MKKNFFQIVMGALVLTLGLSSCKKDKNCADCVTISDPSGDISYTNTYCLGDDKMKTQAEFDAYVAHFKSEGYKVVSSKKCE
jgi:hypothetical protein